MDTNAYPDSSFLVSLVAQDKRSADASAHMARTAEPLFFTPLHRIEARNALRNAAGRGAITDGEKRAAFHRIDEDVREGFARTRSDRRRATGPGCQRPRPARSPLALR